ncbi:MAG: AAA family ATPase [Acidobacteria bacterium]|nr:AAA family ATPase [Acidobacteriota bacterium]
MDPDRAIIISRDAECVSEIRLALRTFNPFLTITEIDPSQQMEELAEILDAGEPLAIFMQADDPEESEYCAAEIHRAGRQTRTIAAFHQIDNTSYLALRRQGLRECVQLPRDRARLQEILRTFSSECQGSQAPSEKQAAPSFGRFLSFVPSKPGAGTSTAAAHFAHFAAEILGARVALVDLDMNCGVQGLIARSEKNASIIQAAQYAGRMEDSIWERLITQAGSVDVLPSTHRSLNTRIEAVRFENLLSYLQNKYPLVIFDHSGNLERYSVTVLERSAHIFSVCAPDLSTVHQARRSMELFEDLHLRSKTSIVMTRDTAATGLSREKVVSMLGTQPVASLPNAFSSLQSALLAGGLAGRNSPYGRAVRTFTDKVLADLRIVTPISGLSRVANWGGLRSAFSRLRSNAAVAR